MKRLLLAPLLVTLLLTSCSRNKYNSAYEAQKACKEWKSDGFWYTYQLQSSTGFYERQRFSKDCIYDKQTRQYVGEEDISVKKGDFLKYGQNHEHKYKNKNFYF